MAERISAKKALELEGYESIIELYEEDPISVPACCSEGCQVESDGVCIHGFPSVFLEMGLI